MHPKLSKGHADGSLTNRADLGEPQWQSPSGNRTASGRRTECGMLSLMEISRLSRFRPISLQLGDEQELLERSAERLHGLSVGEVAVLPEYLAWTADRSEIALANLLGIAKAHHINVIATLNLRPELTEDLPGRDEQAHYNALVVVTRHGDIHVPQAKVTPQAFEMATGLQGPGIGVSPYRRINRVRFDIGTEVIEVRFFICSDLWALTRMTQQSVSDLWIVPGNFAFGAERYATRLLAMARGRGWTKASLMANAYHQPKRADHRPLAVAIEELVEGEGEPGSEEMLRDAFRVYADEQADSFVSMVNLKEREGRIAVPRSLAEAPIAEGEYPVTIVL